MPAEGDAPEVMAIRWAKRMTEIPQSNRFRVRVLQLTVQDQCPQQCADRFAKTADVPERYGEIREVDL